MKAISIISIIIISSQLIFAQKSEIKYYLLERYFDDNLEEYVIESNINNDTLSYTIRNIDSTKTIYSYKLDINSKTLYKHKAYNNTINSNYLYPLRDLLPCVINLLEFEINDKTLKYTQAIPSFLFSKEQLRILYEEGIDPYDYHLKFYFSGLLTTNIKANVKLNSNKYNINKINCKMSRYRFVGTMPINKESWPIPYEENIELYPISKYKYDQLTTNNRD